MRILLMMALIVATGCDDRVPTAPGEPSPSTATSPPLPSQMFPDPQPFDVSGRVTGDRGAPLAGAVVTMAHYESGEAVQFPSVVSDASGSYRIAFAARTLRRERGQFVARAEVVAQGYELQWRSLVATTDLPFVEHFQLHRIQRVTAGESFVVSYTPDIGECPGWVAQVCGTARVTVPRGGNVTVEVVPTTSSTGLPELEACCVDGNEVYGNPVTVPATAGSELEVRVGLGSGVTGVQSFRVKTSLEPF